MYIFRLITIVHWIKKPTSHYYTTLCQLISGARYVCRATDYGNSFHCYLYR